MASYNLPQFYLVRAEQARGEAKEAMLSHVSGPLPPVGGRLDAIGGTGGRHRTHTPAAIDIEGGRAAEREMTKVLKKPNRVTARLGRLAELRPASLSARDPVAFAAALMILG